MSKNPEFARQASEIVRHQDAIRSANEELIKLSQRFGRMMPRLSRLDPSVILSWLSLYSKIKDRSKRTDEEMDGWLEPRRTGLLQSSFAASSRMLSIAETAAQL